MFAAEKSFLRRQLALYQERGIKAGRGDRFERFTLGWLSQFFDWRSALVVVKPRTLIAWHRAGFRLLWKWKSRPGLPPIPVELRHLIRHMAQENPLWGEERIADELFLKLGIRVSPRTVRKYLPKCNGCTPRGDQRWSTFLRNHAKGILACDFFLAVTVTFRCLYVFVVIHHASRRLVHLNVTDQPSAEWTQQQLREAIGCESHYRYLLRDRDAIFPKHLDRSIATFGLQVLNSPPQSAKANAICERVIGTIRRQYLDWVISLNASHLRQLLKEWKGNYNAGRPHKSLGPGIPDFPANTLPQAQASTRHKLIEGFAVRAQSIIGGLHHEYGLGPA